MKLPIILSAKLKKGLFAYRDTKLGGFNIMIVWLKKKYKTGTVFDIKDIDKVEAILHFADKESLDVTIGLLEQTRKDWK